MGLGPGLGARARARARESHIGSGLYKPEAELCKLQEDKVNRDEYLVELEQSDKGKIEEVKLKI